MATRKSKALLKVQGDNNRSDLPWIKAPLEFTKRKDVMYKPFSQVPWFNETAEHAKAWKYVEETVWDNPEFFMHPALEYILTYTLPWYLKDKQEYMKHWIMTTVYNVVRMYSNTKLEIEKAKGRLEHVGEDTDEVDEPQVDTE